MELTKINFTDKPDIRTVADNFDKVSNCVGIDYYAETEALLNSTYAPAAEYENKKARVTSTNTDYKCSKNSDGTYSWGSLENMGKTYTAGSNIQISSDNKISATDTTYTAGDGIDIDSDNKIAVKYDNSTIKLNSSGKLYATGGGGGGGNIEIVDNLSSIAAEDVKDVPYFLTDDDGDYVKNNFYKGDVEQGDNSYVDTSISQSESIGNAIVANDKIWCFNNNGGQFYTFDTSTKTFTASGAKIPYQTTASCVMGDYIYTFNTGIGEVYKIDTINIGKYNTIPQEVNKDLTHVAVAVGTNIYCFGDTSYASSVLVLDTTTDSFTQLSGVTVPLTFYSGYLVDKNIYLIPSDSGNIYKFNVEDNTFTNTGITISNKLSLATVKIDNYIYIFGSEYGYNIYKLNVSTDTLETLTTTIEALTRAGVYYDNYIWTFGDKVTCQFWPDAESLVWTKVTNIGTTEEWTFTLEDGTTVTKKVRVVE